MLQEGPIDLSAWPKDVDLTKILKKLITYVEFKTFLQVGKVLSIRNSLLE